MQTELSPVQTRDGNDEQAIIREARERAQYAYEYWWDQHQAWKQDVEFIGGNQWDQKAKQERIDASRPFLTINTFPQYIDQVMGDILQNRPSIHVSASDSDAGATKLASEDGKTNYSLAECYEGLIRNIEYVSGAESHYDTAVQHAIESGMGWLRVLTRYVPGPSWDQELWIGSVRNRWAVLMDPDTIEPDMSDAGWGFVLTDMVRNEFMKRYPGKGEEVLVDTTTMREKELVWATTTKVRLAEYFRREPVKRRVLLLSNGIVQWEDELKGKRKDDKTGKMVDFNVLDDLEKTGVTVQGDREIETYKVLWVLMNGSAILEKETVWPGDTIPIVPVAGKRLDLEDGSLYTGLIHHAKDAKRADNYYISAAVERIGMAPKAPWVLYADEIEGHEAQWSEANTKNHAYLLINSTGSNTRPQRTESAPMPAAELQMSAIMTDRVKSTIGMYDAAVGARSNETSGKAILARQRESDTGTYAYSDNLAKAIRRVGIICTEVIPKIYDGTRVIRLRDRSGKSDWVKINATVKDEASGNVVLMNDIRAAKMDVVAKAGPSYTTQRMEAAEAMLEFVRVVPQAGQIMLDKIAANMDWPGADDIAARLIKMVPMQFLTEREIADNKVEPPTPTPEQEAEMSKNKAIMATAEATMKTAEANIAAAQVEMRKLDQLAAGGDEQVNMIRDMVSEALAEVLAAANQATPAPAPAKPDGKAKTKAGK